MDRRKKLLNRAKVWLKLVLIFFSLLFSFSVFLIVVLIFNVPYIRKAIFGKLPFKVDKKPWSGIKTIEYIEGLYIDIFYPRSRKRGTVLFAHGGGWISGYRRQPNNLSWYKFLVSKGFVVAAVDYSRGYKGGIEKLIEELSHALIFLNKNAVQLGLPNEKISLMGLSAGGHLALLTAAKMYTLVKNVVAYYAPCDLLDVWESPSLFARIALITTLKRLPTRSKEVYAKFSPINVAHASMPPVLLVHGKRDSIVPYESSVKMFRKLKKLGCRVKLLTHPQANHGFEFVLRDEKTKQIIEQTVEFLSEGGSN